VITDLNPFRLELAKHAAHVTEAVNSRDTTLQEVQKKLGMQEGFDVGMEMSGNALAFRELLANLSHGAKVAMLGIPSPSEMSIDWSKVIFNQYTIRGIYGREMYETWYKMTVMLQSGLDISKVITHRLAWNQFEEGFAAMHAGNSGKVILDWQNIS
jgi:threonine 3-dehydrogenase